MTVLIKNQSDSKGLQHGYWEIHYTNGNICYKGNFNHGKPYGYWELYDENQNILSKEFCI